MFKKNEKNITKCKERFLRKCKENNILDKIEFVDEYKNSKTKLHILYKPTNEILFLKPRRIQDGHFFNDSKSPKNYSGKKKTHEDFLKECEEKGILEDVEILGIYKGAMVKIPFRCKKHNVIWESTPNNILRGHRCYLCGTEITAKKSLISEEEFKQRLNIFNPDLELVSKYKKMEENVKVRCKLCNNTFEVSCIQLLARKYGCPFCGNTIKFPNRLIRCVVKNLNVDYYKPEYNPEWIKPKQYDMYIEDKKLINPIIIEMDGELHFRQRKNSSRTLEESKQIDIFKEEKAKEHNILVIRIDCHDISHNKIIENLKNSELKKYFDLESLPWDDIIKEAESNWVKMVCEDYNNDSRISVKDLAQKYDLHNSTIRKYLKRGTEFGWCKYIPSLNGAKKIKVLDKNKKELNEFNSIKECIIFYKEFFNIFLDNACISKSFKENKLYKNMYFIYI